MRTKKALQFKTLRLTVVERNFNLTFFIFKMGRNERRERERKRERERERGGGKDREREREKIFEEQVDFLMFFFIICGGRFRFSGHRGESRGTGLLNVYQIVIAILQ